MDFLKMTFPEKLQFWRLKEQEALMEKTNHQEMMNRKNRLFSLNKKGIKNFQTSNDRRIVLYKSKDKMYFKKSENNEVSKLLNDENYYINDNFSDLKGKVSNIVKIRNSLSSSNSSLNSSSNSSLNSSSNSSLISSKFSSLNSSSNLSLNSSSNSSLNSSSNLSLNSSSNSSLNSSSNSSLNSSSNSSLNSQNDLVSEFIVVGDFLYNGDDSLSIKNKNPKCSTEIKKDCNVLLNVVEVFTGDTSIQKVSLPKGTLEYLSSTEFNPEKKAVFIVTVNNSYFGSLENKSFDLSNSELREIKNDKKLKLREISLKMRIYYKVKGVIRFFTCNLI